MSRKKKRQPRSQPPRELEPTEPPVDVVLALCRSARKHLTGPRCRGIDAELWSSETLGLVAAAVRFPDERAAALADFIDAMGAVPRPGAREALLAFAAVGEAELGSRAREAAARMPGPDPRWIGEAGAGDAVSAWCSSDPDYDDGTTYAFEIRRPSGTHVLCVYIDNNIGGIPKDAFLLPSVAAFRTPFDRGEAPGVRLDQVPVAAAAASVRGAVKQRRHYFDPPGSEDLTALESLIDGHLRFLPAGVAPDREPLDDETLEALAADFLAAPESKGHRRGDSLAILDAILWFGNAYNVGGPLRWSPVVVELFLADWVGRKLLYEHQVIARIPAVLHAFVRFAGRVRGVPEARVAETLAAIETWTPDLLARGGTPSPHANAVAIARALLDLDEDDPFGGDDSFGADDWFEDRAWIAGKLHAIAGPRPPDDEIEAAATTLRERLRAKDDLAVSLRELLPWQRVPRRDDRLVAGLAGAWAAPAGQLYADDDDIDHLEFLADVEPYDWLGLVHAVIDDKPVTADRLGRRLARAEGVVRLKDASTRRTFGAQLVAAWQSLGHLDEHGGVTPLGRWAIPTGVAAAFGYDAR